MSLLLTIDIGNTNLTLGVYDSGNLVASWRLATDHTRMPDEYGVQILSLLQHRHCSPDQLKGICLASVVPPLTSQIVKACKQYLKIIPMVVDSSKNLGIKILYDDPLAVGADRIVDAVAVQHLYGGPACVVDFGTATTFDAITAEGCYLGGAITPGIQIAAEALYLRTSRLLKVEIERPPSVIGKNTTHAIQSGLLFGYVALVEGMVKRFRGELGENMKVIATGGLAEVIADETPIFNIIAPWLTLDGLRLIWEMNNP